MVDKNVFADGGRRGSMNDINSAEGVTSENLWDRTDVLAGKDSFQQAFSVNGRNVIGLFGLLIKKSYE